MAKARGMWFQQLALFRLDPAQLPDFDKLDTALARHPFAPCGGLDWYSDGFVPAAPHKPDQMLARTVGAALQSRYQPPMQGV